jgi:hypothetical protein
MGLGYEGYVALDVDGTEDIALGIGASIPKARQRLDSASGYGGEISTPVGDIGIGSPHIYDWTGWDGTIDFEIHEDFLTNQIIPWVFDRQAGANSLTIVTRGGGSQTFSGIYWNSISINATEGSILAGTISFMVIEQSAYAIGGTQSKTGGNQLCQSVSPVPPAPLNPNADNITPIPYWNTIVNMDSTDVPFTNWSLEFQQEFVKFFACEHNVGVQEPMYVAAGPLSILFTADYIPIGASVFTAPDTVPAMTITMGSETLNFEDLELQSRNDALQSSDSPVPIYVEYAPYTMTT